MASKIEAVETTEKKEESKYPYLGITRHGSVVWFVSPNKGIALKHGDSISMLRIDSDWIESDFTPFIGTLKSPNHVRRKPSR